MSNVGVGPPFPLIEKKIMFYSLALSNKLSLIHGDFLTYQDVLLGSPRSFLFTYHLFKKKYIESYNHLDILHINYGPRLKSLF